MAQRDPYDDDDSFWSRVFKPVDEDETTTPPPPPPSAENFDAQSYAASLIKQPIVAPRSELADVPDLRTAANMKFVSSGIYFDPATGDAAAETPPAAKPRSWKLPGTSMRRASTILGDDTAFGPGALPLPPVPNPPLVDPIAPQREAAPSDGELRPPPPPPAPPDVPTLTPPSAIPAEPAAPLEHPDVRAGLTLTAADSILRKAGEVVSRVLGGNPDVMKQAFDALGAVVKTALPPEHHASVDKSADAAMMDAQQRSDERQSAERNRAAIQTLTERSAEAAREHQEALISGDPAKTAEARREAVQAWRAERLARGDSPTESNVGARALNQRMRETALRHRLAQRDDAGIERAIETDVDAKVDSAATQRIIADIRRIRREDPARSGEASVEREIETRKADGRVDSDEEEMRERAKLRWQAQAQRGIPEERRRVFTNEEHAAIRKQAEEVSDPVERERFIAARDATAGSLAERVGAELTRPLSPQKGDTSSGSARTAGGEAESDDGAIVPAQDKRNDPPPGVPAKTEAERRAEADAEYSANRDLDVADWTPRLEELVRLAKKYGVIPSQFKKIAYGMLVIGETPAQRVAAARALVEIDRLFPGALDDLPEHHRRLAREIDQLAQNPALASDPNALLDEAHMRSQVPRSWSLSQMFGPRRVGQKPKLGVNSNKRALTPEQLEERRRLIRESNKVGGNAEEQGTQIIKRDIERLGVAIQPKKRVYIPNDGYTVPDAPLGARHDQIRVHVETKKLGARHRDPQRRRLRAIGAHYVEIDPESGDMRAMIPPYDKWIAYNDWLQVIEDILRRER